MWSDTYNLGMQILGFYGYEGHRPGGFLESLLTTWSKADSDNKDRLISAFPELVALLERFGSQAPVDFLIWLEKLP